MPADRSNSGSFSQVHSQFAVCQVPVDSARNAFLKTNLGFPIEEGFCFGNVCPRRFNIHGRAFCNNDFRGLYSTLLEKWMGLDAKPIVNGSFEQLDFI